MSLFLQGRGGNGPGNPLFFADKHYVADLGGLYLQEVGGGVVVGGGGLVAAVVCRGSHNYQRKHENS